MKRLLTIALIITGIGLAGFQANAWQRGGQSYYVDYLRPGVQYDRLAPVEKEKLDIFFANTENIRKQMAVKRSEKQSLNRSSNPDPVALNKVEGELVDLRKTMREKAEKAGVTAYICSPNAPVELRTSEPNSWPRNRRLGN